MKKLLIISYFFAPAAKIGAVRWTKLAKYLNATGKYDIDIITGDYECAEDKLLAADLDKVGNVIRIPHSDSRFGFVGAGGSNAKSKGVQSKVGLLKRIKKSIKNIKFIRTKIQKQSLSSDYERSLDFFEQTKSYILKNGGPEKYDIVISTFGPVGDSLLADWITETYPDIPLIMDFRDIMNKYYLPKEFFNRYSKIQSHVCSKASAVVCVSDGMTLTFKDIVKNKPLVSITNGYDTDDFSPFAAEKSDKFIMSYTGSLYDGKANFTPLFKMLSELSDSRQINLSDIEIHYAGMQFEQLYLQASKYRMESLLIDNGFIQREEALKLQQSSNILLLATFNTKNDQGILSGKLLEYINTQRPIAAFVAGDIAECEVRDIINRGNFGAAYEEANKEADYAAMKQYILDEYNAFKNGTTTFAPVAEVISGFDYKNLASRYDELIERITK